MKKSVLAVALVAMVMLSGCSGVSQEEYNSLVAENSRLQEANTSLENENKEAQTRNDHLVKSYNALQEDYDKLENKYSNLESQTKDWINFSDTEKKAEQARADADKSNAEAEKIEAQARLKAANEKLSEAEAIEQRKLTEGTTVYEDKYIKINFLEVGKEYSYGDYCAVFLVENKTNGVLTIQGECVSLDGVDIGNITMSDPVSPQSKGKVYASSRGLKYTKPKVVSGQLRVIDFDQNIFATSYRDNSYNANFVNVAI